MSLACPQSDALRESRAVSSERAFLQTVGDGWFALWSVDDSLILRSDYDESAEGPFSSLLVPSWMLLVMRSMKMTSVIGCLVLLLLALGDARTSLAKTGGENGGMAIEIDARDLPRRLLSARVTIPVESIDEAQSLPLWYPKWVPGSHGPGGPIANIAGLVFHDQDDQILRWTRTPGEVYRIEVQVPANTSKIVVHVRYIANQPTTNSMGHDTFVSTTVGLISPGTVLMYPEGASIDEMMISTKLMLPNGWQAASALSTKSSTSEDSSYDFEATSLRNFVDSPIMCGLHYQSYSLNPEDPPVEIAPHVLHVFSEEAEAVELDTSIIDGLREMVVQTAKLTGSQPFDSFDILLAASDVLPANGLEHSRSTMNILPTGSLRSLGSLKGWSRLLIPHEYLHTWCGKYRRPTEMVVDDFHSAKGTDLLWVYEGLTQYLGELVEARSGFMNVDEFRHRISVELRNAVHQENRQWRPLLDTAAASHVLRDGSPSWPRLRGGQDYYMEGMLFWLEADAILRSKSEGQRSLDDFCQKFFEAPAATATKLTCPPKPFDREEIVDILNGLAEYDWDGLIRRRVENTRSTIDAGFADLLGYEFKPITTRPDIPASTFRFPGGIDHFDTLGLRLSGDGGVLDVVGGSPADLAKLGPGMKIIGIEGLKWDASRLEKWVQRSANSDSIDLTVAVGDQLRPVQLQYSGGPRYVTLVRKSGEADVLEKIVEAL